MSRIDELIAEHCPGGVDVQALGDIATLVRGNGMPKSQLSESGTGAIHYGQIYTYYGVWADTTISFVTDDDAKKLATAEPGDIIITNTSENLDDVGKAVAWLGSSAIVTGGHATVIKHKQDAKFLSYWFASEHFFQQKRKLASGAKVIDVSARQLAKVRVPVPPLEVQREIVRVLDQFTQLEAELEAELEARRQQYAHYSGVLLGTAGVRELQREARRLKLDDLFDLRAGQHISSSRINNVRDGDHPYPCYGGGGLRGYVGEYNQEGLRALVGRQGALCGNVKRADGRFYATEHSVVVTPKPDVDLRWAFHLLSAMNLHQYASKSAQPGLAVSTLKRLEVDVPSPGEQRQIADVLDRFDALVNDLSSGLPAEIAARRQQYEHYRDRLLTFKEAA